MPRRKQRPDEITKLYVECDCGAPCHTDGLKAYVRLGVPNPPLHCLSVGVPPTPLDSISTGRARAPENMGASEKIPDRAAKSLFLDGIHPPAGCPMPTWESQPPAVKAAHIRKAQLVIAAMSQGGSSPPVAESPVATIRLGAEAQSDALKSGEPAAIKAERPDEVEDRRGSEHRERPEAITAGAKHG